MPESSRNEVRELTAPGACDFLTVNTNFVSSCYIFCDELVPETILSFGLIFRVFISKNLFGFCVGSKLRYKFGILGKYSK